MKVGVANIMQQSANNRNEAEMAAANERANLQAAANNVPQYTAAMPATAMPATSMPAMQAEPAQTTAAFANMAVTSQEPIAAAAEVAATAEVAAPEEMAQVYDDASGTFV